MKKTRRLLAGLMLATAAATGAATAAAGTHSSVQADTAWGAADPGTSTTDDTAWGTPPTDGSGSTGGTAVTPMDTAWG